MLKIGIAGLGTVGKGVVKILQNNAELLTQRTNEQIQITAVSARDKSRDRGITLDSSINWYEDAVELANDNDVDVVVEVIGGDSGVAYDLCKAALSNGKHVVTANKALIAKHGTELAKIAEKSGVALAFEAAVAGGIPIIKGLKEGLAGNKISRVAGIMNGTCNYILTTMRDAGRTFDDVLKEAQKLGYAEADPTFDVDGIDTAHKLVILTSIAFGTPVNFDKVTAEGIREITIDDIRYAADLGYAIKLLGICEETKDGISQNVYPAMVPLSNPIAGVDGVNNAVQVHGDAVGSAMFEGPGAGEGPTASAVVADIADIAAKRFSHPFGIATSAQKKAKFLAPETRHGAYYVRLQVKDESGVLASITKAFEKSDISLEAIIQKPHQHDDKVTIVAVTHDVLEKTFDKAMERITSLPHVVGKPFTIRVEG